MSERFKNWLLVALSVYFLVTFISGFIDLWKERREQKKERENRDE